MGRTSDFLGIDLDGFLFKKKFEGGSIICLKTKLGSILGWHLLDGRRIRQTTAANLMKNQR